MKKTLEKPFPTSRGGNNPISTPEKKICDQKNFSVHLNSTNHHENSYFLSDFVANQACSTFGQFQQKGSGLPTAPSVPRRSPIQVLTELYAA